MDKTQLKQLIIETPTMVYRHKQNMHKTTTYNFKQETINTGTQSGSKPPLNIHSLQAADLEASTIGTIAYYCYHIGSIEQAPPLKAFIWNHNGCQGLKIQLKNTTPMKELERTCEYLLLHIEEVLNTEGIEEYLSCFETIRAYSRKCFPNELVSADNWIDLQEALSYSNWSINNLKLLVNKGHIETTIPYSDNEDNNNTFKDRLFSKRDIDLYLKRIAARRRDRIDIINKKKISA